LGSALKTLVFCTAYAATAKVWANRYRRWIDGIDQSILEPDQILIVDDGSPSLPGWPDTQITSSTGLEDAAFTPAHSKILLHHFQHRLGRRDVMDFPGWYRSFVYAARYAEMLGFERIVHIESDAFLISPRAQAWFRDFAEGWAALWSTTYAMPESACQIAAGAGLGRLRDFVSQPYENLIGVSHEKSLRLTHIEKSLRGARYGETEIGIPHDADYAAQVHSQREDAYYWWLNPPAPVLGPALLDWHFGAAGVIQAPLRDGWHMPEAGHQWMNGTQSLLTLPATKRAGRITLRMEVEAHISPALPRQRLIIFLNSRFLHEFELTERTILGCDIQPGLLRLDGRDKLRFLHPDAAVPSLVSNHPDTRLLSIMLIRLELLPHQSDRDPRAN
jgi:hypothetical protein